MKTITFVCIQALLIFLGMEAHAQLVSVSGTVRDQYSDKIIKQISVVDVKSGIGTISSDNGNFLLLLKSGEVKLLFSDDKFETFSTTFQLLNDTSIFVKLQPLSPEAGRKIKQERDDPSNQSGIAAIQVIRRK